MAGNILPTICYNCLTQLRLPNTVLTYFPAAVLLKVFSLRWQMKTAGPGSCAPLLSSSEEDDDAITEHTKNVEGKAKFGFLKEN